MSEQVREQTDSKKRMLVCSDLPPGLAVPLVRLLIANALGQDIQVGAQILYSLKTGACVVGPKDDEQVELHFGLQKSMRILRQSMAGELTGTARDRDTVSAIDITEVDVLIGQITGRLKSFFRRK